MFKKICNTVNKVKEVNRKITSFTSFLSGSINKRFDDDFDEEDEDIDDEEDFDEEDFEVDESLSYDEYQAKMQKIIEMCGGIEDCNTSSNNDEDNSDEEEDLDDEQDSEVDEPLSYDDYQAKVQKIIEMCCGIEDCNTSSNNDD